MRRRLPPLQQIEAFVEAARAPSFRVAAENCALSPAAFTRRVQGFSAFMERKLFERGPAGLRLTEAGRRCLVEIEPAYLELRRATASLACSRGDDGVKLSLSHSLAVGWLIPRLDSFRAAHPDIKLSLRTQRDASAVRSGEADIGLCFSDVDLGGLTVHPLLEVTAVPVAAPRVAAAFEAGLACLEGQRLLTVTRPPDMWRWWAATSGAGAGGDLAANASFDLLHAMYEAASQGLGIAMGVSPTIWPHLESGRLIRLPLPAARFPGGYRLVAADRKRRAAVTSVWRWLEAEASRTPALH